MSAVALPSVAPVALAVTDTPASATAFPCASCRRTDGCGTRTTPLAAFAGGCVTMASCAAAPAWTANDGLTAPVRPVALAPNV